ncbi:MAG: hypothetical protein ABEH38_00945, partial [Flavobacteriales bacterium]
MKGIHEFGRIYEGERGGYEELAFPYPHLIHKNVHKVIARSLKTCRFAAPKIRKGDLFGSSKHAKYAMPTIQQLVKKGRKKVHKPSKS